jgi:HSP20 family molecular chaperone IbpA
MMNETPKEALVVLNQTLGLNSLRQDLNRLYYAAPIGTSPFAPNGFYGQTGFYAPSFYAPASFYGPQALYAQNAFYGPNAGFAPAAQYAGQVQYQGAQSQGQFLPKANVAETPEATLISVELPGVELGQVQLSIHGNTLILEGVRQPGGLIGDRMVTYQHTEGRFGTFRWACPIPNGTMATQIEAIFRNGLLTIALPKAGAPVGVTSLVGQAAISPAPVAQIVINPAVNG